MLLLYLCGLSTIKLIVHYIFHVIGYKSWKLVALNLSVHQLSCGWVMPFGEVVINCHWGLGVSLQGGPKILWIAEVYCPKEVVAKYNIRVVMFFQWDVARIECTNLNFQDLDQGCACFIYHLWRVLKQNLEFDTRGPWCWQYVKNVQGYRV